MHNDAMHYAMHSSIKNVDHSTISSCGTCVSAASSCSAWVYVFCPPHKIYIATAHRDVHLNNNPPSPSYTGHSFDLDEYAAISSSSGNNSCGWNLRWFDSCCRFWLVGVVDTRMWSDIVAALCIISWAISGAFSHRICGFDLTFISLSW